MADKQTNLNDYLGDLFRQGYTSDSDGTTHDLNVNVRGGSVTVTPVSTADFADGSGTIAVGGVSQQVFAVLGGRRYLLIQNNSADILWINFEIAAVQTQPSIKLLPNGSFESGLVVSADSVHIIGPNAGATFTAKQA